MLTLNKQTACASANADSDMCVQVLSVAVVELC